MSDSASTVSLTARLIASLPDRRRRVLAAVALVAAAILGPEAADAHADVQPNGPGGTWHLIFDDEFNASALNTSVWTPGWNGTGITAPVGDNTRCFSSANVSESGGALHLVITPTPVSCGGPTTQTTDSMVESDPSDGVPGHVGFSYSYGFVEWRAQVSTHTGSGCHTNVNPCYADWPALWSVNDHVGPWREIDTLDAYSQGDPCWGYVYNTEHFSTCLQPNFSDDLSGWHTYGSWWKPGEIDFYKDGVQIGTYRDSRIDGTPENLIMWYTTRQGTPFKSTAGMDIDYVRVWQ